MVCLYRSPIPVRRSGVISSFQNNSSCLPSRRGRGVGVGTLRPRPIPFYGWLAHVWLMTTSPCTSSSVPSPHRLFKNSSWVDTVQNHYARQKYEQMIFQTFLQLWFEILLASASQALVKFLEAPFLVVSLGHFLQFFVDCPIVHWY